MIPEDEERVKALLQNAERKSFELGSRTIHQQYLISGYLYIRREGTIRVPKKFWCVLKDNVIYYFISPKDKEPKGMINLNKGKISFSEDISSYLKQGSLSSSSSTTTTTSSSSLSSSSSSFSSANQQSSGSSLGSSVLSTSISGSGLISPPTALIPGSGGKQQQQQQQQHPGSMATNGGLPGTSNSASSAGGIGQPQQGQESSESQSSSQSGNSSVLSAYKKLKLVLNFKSSESGTGTGPGLDLLAESGNEARNWYIAVSTRSAVSCENEFQGLLRTAKISGYVSKKERNTHLFNKRFAFIADGTLYLCHTQAVL